jgi:hypothetical protein
MAVFWIVAPCSLAEVYRRSRGAIALMMEAERTSETFVNVYQTTRRYKPEDSHLLTQRRENLKSYNVIYTLLFIKLSLLKSSFFLIRSLYKLTKSTEVDTCWQICDGWQQFQSTA